MLLFAWLGWMDDGAAFPRCVCIPSLDSPVPWLQDPAGNWFLVDTGAPRSLITSAAAGIASGEVLAHDLPLENEVLVSDALPEDLLSAPTDEPIGGVIGADLLLQQPWWRDGDLVTFEPPEGLTALASVAVEPSGGGWTCLDDGQCYAYGATRLLVEAEIDGRVVTLLFDTGATYVTVGGSAAPEEDFVEARVRVGDLERSEVLVARADAELDQALVALSEEVGRPVDGLLGQSMLEGYVVGVADGVLTLSIRE